MKFFTAGILNMYLKIKRIIINSGLFLLKRLGHQHWIRQGVRHRLITLFCSPDKKHNYPFEIDFFGWRYQGNLNNFIDWMAFFYEAYERQYGFFMRDLLRQGENPVFVDVGANVGQHSLYLSKYCKAVYSFEPYDPVRNVFNQHIQYNHIRNIFVYPVGLGDSDAELDFYEPTEAHLGIGSFIHTHSDKNKIYRKLPIRKADDYFSQQNIDTKIDLIKIDVEGAEESVLKGMRMMLIKHRPFVCAEYSVTTSKQVGSIESLLKCFPENYLIKTFVPIGTRAYQLVDFHPQLGHQDVLFYPKEKSLLVSCC